MRACLLPILCSLSAWASGGSVEGTVTVKKDGVPGSVKNALVYIKGYRTDPQPGPLKMSQSGRAFLPVVLPVVHNGSVLFSNDELDESIYHHVFSPTKVTKIDSDKYKPGASYASKKLSSDGPFEVFCDIHREMISTIYVVPNDRFALLSAAEGSSAPFKIDGIRPGTWTIVGWHRSSKAPVELPLEIKEGQTTHLDLLIDGESGIEKLLKAHKRLTKEDYGVLKADGGSPGEAVGLEDKWK